MHIYIYSYMYIMSKRKPEYQKSARMWCALN